jgi:uncharacterized protein (TIGR00299 family) protein
MTERLAYLDLANGVSGDMVLAALAHAGRRSGTSVDNAIIDAVASLSLDVTVSFVDDERGGMSCLRADVKEDGSRYTARQLRDALTAADVSESVRARALRAMELLVAAEGSVHGVDPDEVHLHELASADTAADLLGAAAGFDALRIDRVAAAPVPVPSGWIRSGHGPLPLPAPATLEILRGASLRGVDGEEELVTPSGAAILVAHDATFGPLPELVLSTVGIGAGSRIGERPNICRVLIGEEVALEANVERCVILEANIDDQTPEAMGYAIDTLIAEGALDAWVTPIVMKKSRPAFQLCVLMHPSDEPSLTEAFFRLTTTLGIRRRETTREILDRTDITVDIEGHPIRVKVARHRGAVVNVAPEFDDCATMADLTGLPLEAVFDRATELARAALS